MVLSKGSAGCWAVKKKKKSNYQIALKLSGKSVSGLICSQKISCYDRPAEYVRLARGPFTSSFVFFVSPTSSICPQSMQMLALTPISADLVFRNLDFWGRKPTLLLDWIEPDSRFLLPHLKHFFSTLIVQPPSQISQIALRS
jgi:hypothetical protein